MAKKKKFYVVWQGVEPGIYDSWKACEQQIKNYNGARFKSFPSRDIAEQAYLSGPDSEFSKSAPKEALSQAYLDRIGNPITPSLSVDAACSGNPGVMEYQGVDTATKSMYFHQGPFALATVNIGEFLALVHGLAILKQQNSTLPIYSDSKIAIGWIKAKKCRTKLPRNAKNEDVFKLIERAEYWLHNNSFPNRIMKWETKAWGEIPADFGRK